MTGILKRKYEAVEGSSPFLSLPGVDDEVSGGSDSGNSSDSVNPGPSAPLSASSSLRREKRLRGHCVRFEGVTVFYFLRRQGFTSVPTQGGSTLGMSTRHSWVRSYTLGEFALEQEKSHRDLLRDHLKQEKLNTIRLKLTKNGTVASDEAESLTLDDISEDDIDLDNTEVDDYFFLQPLTTRRRRALLRASGVRRIDVEEKQDLRTLRVSREECGCDCRGRCDPHTCACSLAGIKCQVNGAVVDRMSFPCGCSKEGCSNASGRVEFNPVRVRTHFLHTIMKLQLERTIELQHQPDTPHGNGYHGDPVSAQRSLQYHLTDAAPRNPMMHLQTANETDKHMEEEEEEEEEEEDDDEYEDDDDEEEEGSSLCSGLSDCSTHSLETSEEEEEEEGEEEEEEEEEENWDGSDEGSAVLPVSHTEVVPLSSVLGFSRDTPSSYTPIKSYYHPSTEYYHIDSSIGAPAPTNPPNDTPSLPSLERATLPTAAELSHPSVKPPHTDIHPESDGQNGCHHGGHDSVEPTDTASSSTTWEGNTAPCGETVELHRQTRPQNHWSREEFPELSAAESDTEGSFTGKAGVSALPDQNISSALGEDITEDAMG